MGMSSIWGLPAQVPKDPPRREQDREQEENREAGSPGTTVF
jgi:hypothetical protein